MLRKVKCFYKTLFCDGRNFAPDHCMYIGHCIFYMATNDCLYFNRRMCLGVVRSPWHGCSVALCLSKRLAPYGTQIQPMTGQCVTSFPDKNKSKLKGTRVVHIQIVELWCPRGATACRSLDLLVANYRVRVIESSVMKSSSAYMVGLNSCQRRTHTYILSPVSDMDKAQAVASCSAWHGPI